MDEPRRLTAGLECRQYGELTFCLAGLDRSSRDRFGDRSWGQARGSQGESELFEGDVSRGQRSRSAAATSPRLLDCDPVPDARTTVVAAKPGLERRGLRRSRQRGRASTLSHQPALRRLDLLAPRSLVDDESVSASLPRPGVHRRHGCSPCGPLPGNDALLRRRGTAPACGPARSGSGTLTDGPVGYPPPTRPPRRALLFPAAAPTGVAARARGAPFPGLRATISHRGDRSQRGVGPLHEPKEASVPFAGTR